MGMPSLLNPRGIFVDGKPSTLNTTEYMIPAVFIYN